ncbi:hypothetical protein CBS101457_001380 [Exobasidium rhododendri]|nr:hypothetical protein CBS101457_001380 [Exobasidium rhododendri]
MSRQPEMASTPSSSPLFTSRRSGSTSQVTPQASKTTDLRSRKSAALDFGTPLNFESTSPFRTPNSSKSSSFLSKTPFGATSKAGVIPSNTPATSQPATTPSQPSKPLTGSAKLTARFRSLWLGGGHATTALLQAKSFLPYSGLAKLMLQTNLDRFYALSLLSIHIFLSVSLIAPLQPVSSLLLPVRPTVFLLSLVAFSLSVLPLIFLHRASITDVKPLSKSIAGTGQDFKIAGVTLRSGSPAAHYYAVIRRKETALSTGVYALSGFSMAASHVLGLMLYSSNSGTWAPYQSVSFRNAQGLRVSSFRPNERLFFLVGSNFIIGALYTLYRALSLSAALSDTSAPLSAPKFEPQGTVESLGSRLSGKIRRRLPKAFLVGSILPNILLLSYFAIRRPLFRTILSIIGHQSTLRPFLIPSFRLRFLTAELAFRNTAMGIFSTLTWEVVNIFWEVIFTQPFLDVSGGLSRFSREPTRCLIEGLQSRRAANANETGMGSTERDYYSHFAFAEMAIVSSTDVDRRRAIFRDVGSMNANAFEGATKSAWVSIAQECLKVLEEERVCLSRRGKQPNASVTTVSTQSNAAQPLKALDANHRVVMESVGSVTQKGPITIWDRLASSGLPASSTPVASPAVSTIRTTSSAGASDGPNSIFHLLAPPPPAETKAVAKPVVTSPATAKSSETASTLLASFLLNSSGSIIKSVVFLIPSDLRHVLLRLPVIRSIPALRDYLFTPSNEMILYIGNVPREAALTTWSIQILSTLLSASVEQDEYGTVALSSNQKLGVDDVLEELASLLLALSEWGAEIAAEMQGQSDSKKQELTHLWDRRVAPIVIASRSALSLVLGVFEPTGFRLQPRVQEKVDRAMAAG